MEEVFPHGRNLDEKTGEIWGGLEIGEQEEDESVLQIQLRKDMGNAEGVYPLRHVDETIVRREKTIRLERHGNVY